MSKTENNRRITKAFTLVKTDIKASIENAMRQMLNLGVDYCLNAHDASHQNHLQMGDSYAWMLIHNGRKVDSKIYAQGATPQGNATKALAKVRRSLPRKGWVGIVLAGVEPITYFSLRYEYIAMNSGMFTLSSQNFDKFFNKVVVR